VIASFDWWLLVVGIVGGAGLVWLVIADFRRREDDIAADEGASEAEWIAATVAETGHRVDEATVEEVLRLHRAYLAAPVPDLDPIGQAAEPPASEGEAPEGPHSGAARMDGPAAVPGEGPGR
jgi:hypothetical protein